MTSKFKKVIKILAISIFVIGILGYGLWQMRDLLLGIDFRIDTIQDGTVYANPEIKIAGIAKNSKKVTLNGREIYLNKDWRFNETIILLVGYNIITVEATDKFNRINKKTYQLIFQP